MIKELSHISQQKEQEDKQNAWSAHNMEIMETITKTNKQKNKQKRTNGIFRQHELEKITVYLDHKGIVLTEEP